MKVSICIPTLCNTQSRLEKLKECIESCLGQTYHDIEVIVVDNASEIDLKSSLGTIEDPRLKIIRNDTTIAMPANFNKALSSATGEILKPMCDDDIIHPDLINGILPFLRDYPFIRIRDRGFNIKSELNWNHDSYQPVLKLNFSWREKYDIIDAVSPTCTIFTRELWEEIGPYSEEVNYIFDYIFMMEAQERYNFIMSINPGCGFRKWAESSTASNRDVLRNFKEMFIFYRRNRSWSFKLSKYLYIIRIFLKVIKNRNLASEFINYLPRYFDTSMT